MYLKNYHFDQPMESPSQASLGMGLRPRQSNVMEEEDTNSLTSSLLLLPSPCDARMTFILITYRFYLLSRYSMSEFAILFGISSWFANKLQSKFQRYDV